MGQASRLPYVFARAQDRADSSAVLSYNERMPLRDHFHPPLSLQRHWHAFHNAWATYIASYFNERLPPGYFAEPNVQFGIAIDVAAFDGGVTDDQNGSGSHQGQWTSPAPQQTITLTATTDIVEVRVFRQDGGPILAGAVELVSPANKDRQAHREAFVQKCATYVREGIGLVIVDVVTSRGGSLHRDLLNQLGDTSTPPLGELYASAYRPIQRAREMQLDIWYELLEVQQPLPTLPLWLLGDVCLRLDLDATYERTCREQRIADLPGS